MQNFFFICVRFIHTAVRLRFAVEVHVDEGDEAADGDLVMDFHLDVRDDFRLAGQHDLAGESNEIPFADRTGKGHAVNLEADDIFGFSQRSGGDKTGFNEPFRRTAGVQGAVVVQVFPFDQMHGRILRKIHSLSLYVEWFYSTATFYLPHRSFSTEKGAKCHPQE